MISISPPEHPGILAELVQKKFLVERNIDALLEMAMKEFGLVMDRKSLSESPFLQDHKKRMNRLDLNPDFRRENLHTAAMIEVRRQQRQIAESVAEQMLGETEQHAAHAQ